jgi:hypothetical protein
LLIELIISEIKNEKMAMNIDVFGRAFSAN